MNALEVANFTEERACSDDAEALPEAPNQTTQNRHDFMSEQLHTR